MKSYWWVNHKQTFKHERDGQFIWSPKSKANGNKSVFYDNLQRVEPGDFIISYAHAHVSLLGVIQSHAASMSKPDGFLNVGDNWDDIGWYVPVKWTKVNIPLKIKTVKHHLLDLLPKKYSPINGEGNGNQGAYLCHISKELFEKISELTQFDQASLSEDVSNELYENAQSEFDDMIQKDIENLDISETEKATLVNARVGHGKYKENLKRVEKSCRLTGLVNPDLLIASHIKRWSLCETGDERLDGNNGLLLAPHVDKLFDRGFISFEKNGKVLVSPRLDDHSIEALGLKEAIDMGVDGFNDEQDDYLDFHREQTFLRAE